VCSSGRYGEGSLRSDHRETTPGGMFAVANPFGLYDLHGNVREWCADYGGSNYEAATIEDRDRRVLRRAVPG
jgi:formylglycine-generating enzyme required for sulfatase activity